MTDINGIIDLAKAYAASRSRLDAVLDEINTMRRQAVRARLRGLRSRVAETSAAKDELRQAILSRPDLFERPRTQAVDGIKFGVRKQPGSIEYADEAQVVKRIRQKLPDQADTLVRTRETLDKTQLRKLPARILAQLGVTIGDPTDEVTIAAAAGDLDKLVDALLDEVGDAADAAA